MVNLNNLDIKIGINPIVWSNDDMHDLGGDIPLEQCLSEANKAGYSGIELGHKFPKDPTKLKPILNMEERVVSVTGCRYVDEVVPDAPWIIDRAWIEKYKIDLVVHGDDYCQEQLESIYNVPISMGIFRTVPYTPGISTAEIIRRCKEAVQSPT